MSELYFEDFHPGLTFTSGTVTITRERMITFAEEFDPQAAHLSEELAATSQFGELIASGWHTASLTMRLQIEAGLGRIAGGIMGAGVEKLAWLRPVRPGDELHAVVEITEIRPSRSRPDRGLVTFLTTTVNQNGEPVETMLGTVIAPKRPQS